MEKYEENDCYDFFDLDDMKEFYKDNPQKITLMKKLEIDIDLQIVDCDWCYDQFGDYFREKLAFSDEDGFNSGIIEWSSISASDMNMDREKNKEIPVTIID